MSLTVLLQGKISEWHVPDQIHDFTGFVISIVEILSHNFDILTMLQSILNKQDFLSYRVVQI
jgi:hypothetical protein